jgi:hypothetical protein
MRLKRETGAANCRYAVASHSTRTPTKKNVAKKQKKKKSNKPSRLVAQF